MCTPYGVCDTTAKRDPSERVSNKNLQQDGAHRSTCKSSGSSDGGPKGNDGGNEGTHAVHEQAPEGEPSPTNQSLLRCLYLYKSYHFTHKYEILRTLQLSCNVNLRFARFGPSLVFHKLIMRECTHAWTALLLLHMYGVLQVYLYSAYACSKSAVVLRS